MDGSSLLSKAGSGILATDGATLIGQDGSSLVQQNGGSVIAAPLIGQDGSSLIGQDGTSIVGNEGSSLRIQGSAGASAANVQAAAAVSGLTLTGGEIDLSNLLLIAPAVNLDGGVLSGSGVIFGNVTNNAGFVSPGQSPGRIRLVGNYAQGVGGTLIIESAGQSLRQLDQLQVTGSVALAGRLDIRAIDGYAPDPADTFSPLSYSSRSGAFTTVSSNATLTFNANGVLAKNNVAVPQPRSGQALNISTRLKVETGDNVLIAGFIVTGSVPKKVIIRGIGPSLPVSGALVDPTLSLDNGAMTNDDWRSNQEQAIIATTIPPKSNLEPAIVATLTPGPHTAILSGKNGGAGVGLVEVYDLEPNAPAQLANISSRGLVQTGDNAMIGGFIVGGNEPAKVIIRAIGPSLPVPGKLADPTLELFDSNANSISNDNWRATQEAEIIASTVPPPNDNEAAIIATLVPGGYTAIVRGNNGSTGVALVEGYTL